MVGYSQLGLKKWAHDSQSEKRVYHISLKKKKIKYNVSTERENYVTNHNSTSTTDKVSMLAT